MPDPYSQITTVDRADLDVLIKAMEQDGELAGADLIDAQSWRLPETTRIVDRNGASPSNLIYDRLASSYDRLHARFLRMAGGEAQSAMEGALAALLAPRLRILDAGCGTGQLARRLQHMEPTLELTLLDASSHMLAMVQERSMRLIQADMASIPLPGGYFDLTFSSWAIEVVAEPARAIAELVRVTRPGGTVCVAFCSDRPGADWIDRMMQRAICWRGTGRFLDPDMVSHELLVVGAIRVRSLPCHGPASVLLANIGG